MTYLETDKFYYNTRIYFRNHILECLPNNETDWYNGYRSWLAEQGCEIVRPDKDKYLAVDVLGVAPGYDRFGFVDEQQALVFMLRWL